MENAISVSLSSSKTSDEYDPLFIEQKSYSSYTGKVTKALLVSGVSSFINPEEEDPNSYNCGAVGENTFGAVFYVYFNIPGTDYILKSSRGSLGTRIIETVEYTEILKCSLETFVKYRYPMTTMLQAPEWIGTVYDEEGAAINNPEVTVTTYGLEFSKPVYGSIRLRYQVIRHRYSYEMTRIEGADDYDEPYYSVVYAVYDGGVRGKTVEVPYGFRWTNGRCGVSNVVIPPDKEDLTPVAPVIKQEIEIEYCTQTPYDD